MKSKFNSILLPALLILIAIVPALSQQGFAQIDIRGDVPIDNGNLADVSDFIPKISDRKPVDVLDTESKVQFRGGTNGWALVGGYALESEIHIEGTATRGDDGIWLVESVGKLDVEKREATLLLKGKAYDGHLILRGTGVLEGGQEFKVILVGTYFPTQIKGEYALGFTGAYVGFGDTGFRIPLMQVGKAFVWPT
ncbi:MAG: hypothetical protein OEM79_06980 [Nitrosopumilus sp.]|nr:hypothetical protein [Nitrosopumilus sp.]